MNLKLLRLSLLALFLPLLHSAGAQCEYTLNMFDSYGDGWNDGSLTITSGSTVYQFTLNGFPFDDGDDSTLTFIVTNGEPLVLEWNSGIFDEEVSFNVVDYNGNLVYETTFPDEGDLYDGIGFCPDCLKPANVQAENVYDTYAKVRWTPSSLVPSLGWWVIYGPKGFVPGPGVGDSLYVTTPKATLTGLSKKTDYDFYVLEMCDSTEFADLVGPVSFQTYWSNDVGITGVLTPESGCDLGVETVKIVMKNFGAKPQSLIPFRFSVNGVDAGVSQPQDGFFTGVLGKDSSEVIEFETTFDFSAPGEYLITVYTEMSGDEDMANDTFRYYIVNRLITPYFQNFETWEGGWYVDTVNSVNSSWEFGTPQNAIISAAASGQNAWVTNLDGPYNSNEYSYLTSPCFDFTDLTEDPVFQASVIYSDFADFDGGWLEISTNDGQSWEKVGAVGEGSNWYNTFNINTGLGDVWSGESDGWQIARILLAGMAGESNVRFRFAFSSFFFFGGEGFGVDDIRVYVPLANDLTGSSAGSQGNDNDCGLQNDKVTFTFINFGTEPQSSFPVAYSINGGAPVVETVNATVQPDQTFTYTFTTPFDSRDGAFDIKCWTNLSGEQNPENDTAYYSVSHLPKPVPFYENFESLAIPTDWTVTGFPFVTNFNNNLSYVLEVNLWGGNDEFIYDLPRYGVISAEDTLSFDYRITDFGSGGQVPTTLSLGTKIEVQVSTNCTSYQNVFSINSLTHVPSINLKTIKVGLGNFAGKSVKIRFKGTWAVGDFYFDLDNINLRACAADMQLTPTVTPSTDGQNGAATVNVGLGNPPYSYDWSTGDTTQTISGLAIGAYTVTVTDALGCTDELTINVGATATQDIESLTSLRLQPNPTSGFAMLRAAFDRPVDVHAEIVDLLGRRIWETSASSTTNLSEQLDLNNFPDGLYLIRLTVDGQTAMRKLVKSR
ncbi:MAG: hypothetical protein EPGJADBJ_01425 [Saprospiraceae bacterium]|nr:hypothetical protein [Saprospiraceae bacterium]